MSRSDRTPVPPARAGQDGVTYSRQYRRCGKKTCSRCAPGNPGHGPYWYASWWENGRRRSRYLGKDLPEAAAISGSAGWALRVQTLGGFSVWRGGESLQWPSKRAAALFKCLLAAPHHRLLREQAIDLLWPDADPSLAAGSLRTATHLLRRTLDASDQASHLLSDGEAITLLAGQSDESGADWLDAAHFQRLAEAALTGDSVDVCRAALDCYAGQYLPDDSYEVWTEPTRGRLYRLHIDLLLHLARLNAASGALEDAEHCLRRVLAEEPSNEEAAASLMNLLAASGRASEALRVYQVLATSLEEDLDVAPGADIEAIRARISASRGPQSPTVISPAVEGRQTNLPAAVSSFIGRTLEVQEIETLLAQHRLVTLAGPGGCGKTRLALEVAGRLVNGYADGVWLVELAGLADPYLVPQVVASTFGIEQPPDVPAAETLREVLQPRDVLLVLDNCEHLIAACAHLTDVLLAGCPRLRVLATSREALQVAGETTYRVPPLAAPDPDHPVPVESLAKYEAIALFADRARNQRSDFVLTTDNAPTVAQICARLDGLPLAIELAAARMGILSVRGIAERLDDRFRLLSGGPRTAMPRQQTLRATMDWSYSLLAPAEQALVRRLSVFAGGWTLEAAETLCAGDDLRANDILDHLDGLSQKSLVTRQENHDEEPRYRMLETVRQYARGKLAESGEEPAMLRAHLEYYATFAEHTAVQLVGPEQPLHMRRLQQELDNIRAAVRWARESGASELGLRVVAPIWRFWLASGQAAEGRQWLNQLMALDSDEHVHEAVRAVALYAAGSLAYIQSDVESARQLYTRCLDLRTSLKDLKGIAEALNGVGAANMELGDYDTAERCFQESLRLRSELGDVLGSNAPLHNLANIAKYRGDYRRACELYEQSLAIEREFGHTHAVLITLDNLAQAWGDQGNYQRAAELNREQLALAREQGFLNNVLAGLGTRAALELEQGELDSAEASCEQILKLTASTGEKIAEGTALINLGEVALARGDPERAAILAGDALSELRRLGHQRGQGFALMTLSDAACMMGNHDRAGVLLEECLALRLELGDALGIALTLEGKARLARARGREEEATRLYGSAEALRAALGSPVTPLMRPSQDQDLADLRRALGSERYESLREEGRRNASNYLPAIANLCS